MNAGVLPALLLSTGAGLSTALGSLIALFSKRNDTRFLALSLGFSAGVMVTVSFAELLPEAQKSLASSGRGSAAAVTACCFIAGVALAVLIDHLIPSHGGDAEPALAVSANNRSGTIGAGNPSMMMRMGVVTAVAITVHNFPEGIATFMAGYSDIRLGLPVALSIAMHNIPEGIAVAVPIYYGTGSRGRAFLYSALSGLSEPIGALAAYLCLAPFLNGTTLGGVFAAVSGIMVYIAFGELVPASERYGHPRAAVAGIIGGAVFMLVAMMVFA